MITAVVLAHNDEEILGRTLESLTWCDEIIVIDDNSTDKTREVAKKYKATVFQRSLDGDFAAQRNFGLSKVKGEWVVFVDSDEVVSPELAEEIKNKIASSTVLSDSGLGQNDKTSPGNDIVGYYIKRRDYMWGKPLQYGETANVKLLRLVKKGVGKWVGPVHEICNISGPAGQLKTPLEHYPHPNVAQFLKEINVYSTLRAKELFDAGVRVSWWQILAYPKAKFFVNYFWRLGFLDGTAGVVMALMMSFHSFLARAKLWKMRDEAGSPPSRG